MLVVFKLSSSSPFSVTLAHLLQATLSCIYVSHSYTAAFDILISCRRHISRAQKYKASVTRTTVMTLILSSASHHPELFFRHLSFLSLVFKYFIPSPSSISGKQHSIVFILVFSSSKSTLRAFSSYSPHYYLQSPLTSHHHVYQGRRTILGVSLPLLQAQRRPMWITQPAGSQRPRAHHTSRLHVCRPLLAAA